MPEELAQETLLRVFRALPKFDLHGKAKLSSWILSIATRLAINVMNKRNTEQLPNNVESVPTHQE